MMMNTKPGDDDRIMLINNVLGRSIVQNVG